MSSGGGYRGFTVPPAGISPNSSNAELATNGGNAPARGSGSKLGGYPSSSKPTPPQQFRSPSSANSYSPAPQNQFSRTSHQLYSSSVQPRVYRSQQSQQRYNQSSGPQQFEQQQLYYSTQRLSSPNTEKTPFRSTQLVYYGDGAASRPESNNSFASHSSLPPAPPSKDPSYSAHTTSLATNPRSPYPQGVTNADSPDSRDLRPSTGRQRSPDSVDRLSDDDDDDKEELDLEDQLDDDDEEETCDEVEYDLPVLCRKGNDDVVISFSRLFPDEDAENPDEPNQWGEREFLTRRKTHSPSASDKTTSPTLFEIVEQQDQAELLNATADEEAAVEGQDMGESVDIVQSGGSIDDENDHWKKFETGQPLFESLDSGSGEPAVTSVEPGGADRSSAFMAGHSKSGSSSVSSGNHIDKTDVLGDHLLTMGRRNDDLQNHFNSLYELKVSESCFAGIEQQEWENAIIWDEAKESKPSANRFQLLQVADEGLISISLAEEDAGNISETEDQGPSEPHNLSQPITPLQRRILTVSAIRGGVPAPSGDRSANVNYSPSSNFTSGCPSSTPSASGLIDSNFQRHFVRSNELRSLSVELPSNSSTVPLGSPLISPPLISPQLGTPGHSLYRIHLDSSFDEDQIGAHNADPSALATFDIPASKEDPNVPASNPTPKLVGGPELRIQWNLLDKASGLQNNYPKYQHDAPHLSSYNRSSTSTSDSIHPSAQANMEAWGKIPVTTSAMRFLQRTEKSRNLTRASARQTSRDIFDTTDERDRSFLFRESSRNEQSTAPGNTIPSLVNVDFLNGEWMETIVWDDRVQTPRPPLTSLLLVPTDTRMIFEDPSDESNNARKDEKVDEGADEQEEKDLDDFIKLSNDRFYRKQKGSRKIIGQINVRHSIPASKLELSLYPTLLSQQELANWHRPSLPDSLLRTPFEIRVFVPKHAEEKHQSGRNDGSAAAGPSMFGSSKREHRYVPKKVSEMSGKDRQHEVVLLEYLEQRPMLLSNVGMCSKIVTYHRKTTFTDDYVPQVEHGEVMLLTPKETPPTSLGDIRAGTSVCTVNNNMFIAPIHKHKRNPTDFLLVYSKGVWWIRECPGSFCVGQIQPKLEIPAPGSRGAAQLLKNRISVYIDRILASDAAVRLQLTDVEAQFGKDNSTAARKILKEVAEFRRDGGLGWTQKDSYFNPSEEEIQDRSTPEDAVAYESMLVYQNELERLGIGVIAVNGFGTSSATLTVAHIAEKMKHLKVPELIRITNYLHYKLLNAPWNTSRHFVQASRGKSMLILEGKCNPFGKGIGFSYVGTPSAKRKDGKAGLVEEEADWYQTKAVKGTEADLRKLNMGESKKLLMDLGVPEQSVPVKRWDRIDLLREKVTEAVAQGTHPELKKFARVIRPSGHEQAVNYKSNALGIFDRQLEMLRKEVPEDVAIEDPYGDSEENEDNEDEEDEKTNLKQKEADEEAERLEFERMMEQIKRGGAPAPKKTETPSDKPKENLAPKGLKALDTIEKRTLSSPQSLASVATMPFDGLASPTTAASPAMPEPSPALHVGGGSIFSPNKSVPPMGQKRRRKIKKVKKKAVLHTRVTIRPDGSIMKEETVITNALDVANFQKDLNDNGSRFLGKPMGDMAIRKRIRFTSQSASDSRLSLATKKRPLDEPPIERVGKISFNLKRIREEEAFERESNKITLAKPTVAKPAKNSKKKKKTPTHNTDYLKRRPKTQTSHRKTRDPKIQLNSELENIVHEVNLNPRYAIFSQPVNCKKFPTYRELIVNPMDLSKLKRQCQDTAFSSRADFLERVGLIPSNSSTFNGPDSEITRLADALVQDINVYLSQQANFLEKLEREINLKRDLLSVITRLEEKPEAVPFLVVPESRFYRDRIKNPISLHEMKNKTKSYSTPWDFIRDMKLMLANAEKFNPPGSIIISQACTLLAAAQELLAQKYTLPTSTHSPSQPSGSDTPMIPGPDMKDEILEDDRAGENDELMEQITDEANRALQSLSSDLVEAGTTHLDDGEQATEMEDDDIDLMNNNDFIDDNIVRSSELINDNSLDADGMIEANTSDRIGSIDVCESVGSMEDDRLDALDIMIADETSELNDFDSF